jgi:hypothetical protein
MGGPLLMRRIQAGLASGDLNLDDAVVKNFTRRMHIETRQNMVNAYKDQCELVNECWGVQIFEDWSEGNQIGLCENFDAVHQNTHSSIDAGTLYQRTVNGRNWNDAGWGDVELQNESTQDAEYERWLEARGIMSKPWLQGSTSSWGG